MKLKDFIQEENLEASNNFSLFPPIQAMYFPKYPLYNSFSTIHTCRASYPFLGSSNFMGVEETTKT